MDEGAVHQLHRLRKRGETSVPRPPEGRAEAAGVQRLLRHVLTGRGGHENDRRTEWTDRSGISNRGCQKLKDTAMKDDKILRQFTAGNNTEEVLALVEELGLFLVSVTHENSIN